MFSLFWITVYVSAYLVSAFLVWRMATRFYRRNAYAIGALFGRRNRNLDIAVISSLPLANTILLFFIAWCYADHLYNVLVRKKKKPPFGFIKWVRLHNEEEIEEHLKKGWFLGRNQSSPPK